MSSFLDSELNEAIRSLTELDIEVVGMSNEEIIQLYKQSMNTEEIDDYNEILTNNMDNSNTLNINEVNINDMEDLNATLQLSVQLSSHGSSKDADLISSHDNHNTYRDELLPTHAIENFCNVLGTTTEIATNFLEVANWDCESAIQLYFESNGTIRDANAGNAIAAKVLEHSGNNNEIKINNTNKLFPLCPLGHELKLSNDEEPWICDATRESRGCLCGVAAFENVKNQERYNCEKYENCLFDYCGPCYNSKITIYSKIENKTSHILETRPKYKNKDNNNNISIAISIAKDSNNKFSTEDDINRNITQNQKYSVTIPNDVIEGDLMVILVDNEEMIVNCREGKKSGDTIIISEDELIPQQYEYTVPEEIVIGEEYTILINNKELTLTWNATDKPHQLRAVSLPRQNKPRNPNEVIEKIKNIEKYGEMLCVYALNGNITSIRKLCDKEVIRTFINYQDNKNGRSALSLSCSGGYKDIVSLLISHGADINIVENYGGTPLFSAVVGDHREIVSLLISEGADVNKRNRNGTSPLYEASYYGYLEIVDMLIDSGADVNSQTLDAYLAPLHIASKRGHMKIVKRLISSGAKVNLKTRNGTSPLHEAIYFGHSEIVDMLIDSGADVNSQTLDAYLAPLHIASKCGHIEIVKRLISSGAKVNLKTRKGTKPLMFASNKNHKEIMEILTNAEEEIKDSQQEHVESFSPIEIDEIEERNRRHLEEALKRGKQKWNRSKIMIVGDGRAGKTALTRSMMGEPFEDTPSTAGINNITCDVKYASIEGECGEWVLYNKPEKELEASLARMIVAQQQLHQQAPETNDFVSVPTIHTVHENATEMVVNENIMKGHNLSSPSVQPVKSVKVEVDDALVMKYLGEIKSSKLTLSIYDYGGQEVFNTIHHLFLTRLGVYVIVFNMEELVSADAHVRETCLSNINMWVNSVVVHTYDKNTNKIAPIILVGTRKDKIASISEHSKISDILKNALGKNKLVWPMVQKLRCEENYSTLLCFMPVDNTKGREDDMILKMMRVIENVVEKSDHVNIELPLSWLKVLDTMTISRNLYLTISEVVKLCSVIDIPINEAESMLSLFNDLGILMWHEEDSLRDVIVLDAVRYFVDPVAVVICNHRIGNSCRGSHHVNVIHYYCEENYYEEYEKLVLKGIISNELLVVMLQLGGDQICNIIRLMLKFGFLVEMNTDIHGASVVEYIVPSLLPEQTRDVDTEYRHVVDVIFSTSSTINEKEWISEADLNNIGFLPRGLFERLISKVILWCKKTSLVEWNDVGLFKNAIYLSYDTQLFCVKVFPSRNIIEMSIRNGKPQIIYRKVIRLISEIVLEFLHSLVFTSCFPLNGGSDDNIWFKPIESILSLLAKRMDLSDPSRHGVTLSGCQLQEKYGIWKDEIYMTHRGNNPRITLWSKLSSCFEKHSNMSGAISVSSVGSELHKIDNYDITRMRNAKIIMIMITSDFADSFVYNVEESVSCVLLEWLLALIFSELLSSQTRIFPVLLFPNSEFLTILDNIPDLYPRATVEKCSSILEMHGITSPLRLANCTARNIVQRIVTRDRYCQWKCPSEVALEYDIWRRTKGLL